MYSNVLRIPYDRWCIWVTCSLCTKYTKYTKCSKYTEYMQWTYNTDDAVRILIDTVSCWSPLAVPRNLQRQFPHFRPQYVSVRLSPSPWKEMKREDAKESSAQSSVYFRRERWRKDEKASTWLKCSSIFLNTLFQCLSTYYKIDSRIPRRYIGDALTLHLHTHCIPLHTRPPPPLSSHPTGRDQGRDQLRIREKSCYKCTDISCPKQ